MGERDTDRDGEVWLRAIAAGDASAFERLYDQFSPKMLGLIRTLLKDPNDAEDALQDAFWYVWKAAGSYDPALGAPGSWLCMIARSRALDRLRQKRRTAQGLADVDVADRSPSAPLVGVDLSPDSPVWSSLAPEQAAAIQMAYVCGLTREEIARVQGVAVGTVKSRVRSGLMQLREVLESAHHGGAR